MTSIKEWQDSMSEMDGWAEAVVYIDEDDVKRWNADKKWIRRSPRVPSISPSRAIQ